MVQRISDLRLVTVSLGVALVFWSSTASCHEQPQTERELSQEQLEPLRWALSALRAADKTDAAELLERAILAHEVTWKGRRDDEARRIQDRAPARGTQAEILELAARVLEESDEPAYKAEIVGEAAKFFAVSEGRERDRPEERKLPITVQAEIDSWHRDHAVRQLEVMRLALHALREAEKEDLADLLERAIRAREVVLEGRRDDEAAEIRERAPSRSDEAEILGLAARIWKERAEAGEKLADQLAAGDRPQAEPARRDRTVPESTERIQRLEDHMARLTEAVETLERRLQEIMERLD